MTLGRAAAAQVWLSCGVRECNHQVETDPAELSQRYDLDTPVLEWRERLVCSRCGRRDVDFVVSGTKEAVSATGGCERNGAAYVCADRSGDAELQIPPIRGTAFSTHNQLPGYALIPV